MISKKYIVFILAIASVAVTLPWAPKSSLIKDVNASVLPMQEMESFLRLNAMNEKVLMSALSLAQLPPPPKIPKVIPEEEVQKFMVEYRDRFMKLKLGPYMDLFLKEAVENRMFPYAEIQEAFRKTIVSSKSIVYKLKIYSIHTYRDGAAVTGHYEIFQSSRKLGKRHLEGDIQWDLVLENGSLKIREINYGRKH
ncbi:MAG: hypothetical protein ACXU9X_09300 [Thermodesulfobacteriota bacterium]